MTVNFVNGYVYLFRKGGMMRRKLGEFRGTTAISGTFAMLLTGLIAAPPDQANAQQALYWAGGQTIGNGDPIAPTGGTWSTSVQNWTPDSTNNSAAVAWTNTPGMTAIFSLPPSTVVYVDNIDVDGTMYFDTIELKFSTFQSWTNFTGGTLQFSPAGSATQATISTGKTGSSYMAFHTPLADGTNGNGDPVNDVFITTGGGGVGGVIFYGQQQYTGTTTLDDGASLALGYYPGTPQFVGGDGYVKGDIVIGNGSLLFLTAWNGDRVFTNVVSGPSSSDFYMISAGDTPADYHPIFLNSDSPSFNGSIYLYAGSFLDGTGSTNGDVEIDGTLQGTTGATNLSFASLTLGSTGVMDATVNAVNPMAALFNFSGDMDVASGTLDLTINGGEGIYNIASYQGTVTGAASTIFASAPTVTGATGTYKILTSTPEGGSPGMLQVVVYDSSDQLEQYWNGGAVSPAGTGLTGGSGTWNGAAPVWKLAPGGDQAFNWIGSLGIFAGSSGGTVTVNGAQNFDQLEFQANDYDFAGTGNLALAPSHGTSGSISVSSGASVKFAVDIANGVNWATTAVTDLTKSGGGTLTFTGTKSYSGTTTVSAGTLKLGDGINSGGVQGDVDVGANARFGGAGSVGGDVTVANMATLEGSQQGILTISGELDLQTGSTIDVTLVNSISSPIFRAGTLTLGGAAGTVVNVTAGAPLIPSGRYYLISSGAAPTGSPVGDLVLGSGVPVGSGIEYSPVGNIYINIGSGSAPAFRYWDGGVTSGSGPVNGGPGTWSASITNWADADPATAHGAWTQGDIAIFAGTSGGSVVVDSASGTIEAGGLHFALDGYSLDWGELELVSASSDNLIEIAVGPSSGYTATINTVLDGAAGINKTGAGTVVLTGDNLFAGGVVLTDGTLVAGDDKNFGAASSTLTFAGGTLAAANTFGSGRAIEIDQHGGTIEVSGGDVLTLSGTIADETGQMGGRLFKSGDGTLVLGGTNTFSGGVSVAGGVLSVGADANLGAQTGGVILDDGTFVATSGFDTSRPFSLGPGGGVIDVSGAGDTLSINGSVKDVPGQSGSLVKTGDGKLSLGGDASYSGGTTISGGTLEVAASGSLAGDVEISGGTVFDIASTNGLKSLGVLSGSGAFNQTGSGTTTLAADSSGFGGTTTVSAGGLAVSGKLGGNINVIGGLLSGTGTLGMVTIGSGGAIVAGDKSDIATLSTGALGFGTGSTLFVNVDADDGHDQIMANGTVTVSGGAVSLIANAGSVTDGEQITIIDSTDSVTTVNGGFNPVVVSSSAYVGADIGYSPTTVYLTLKDLTNGGQTLCLPGMTANQCAAAGGIHSLGPDNPLGKIIGGLPADQLGPALDQLTGQVLASVGSGMMENSRFVREATNEHLQRSLGGVETGQDGASVSNYLAETETGGPFDGFAESNSGIGLWGRGYGGWSSFDGTTNASGMDDDAGGVFAGIDVPAFDTMRFGAVFGYGAASYSIDDLNSSSTSDDYTFGFYGGGRWDAVAANAGMAYTWSDVSTERNISIPGLVEQETGSYGASTFQVYADVSYRTETTEGHVIEPFIDAAYVYQQSDDYTEAGGAAALAVQSNDNSVGFSTIGIRGAYNLMLGEYDSALTGSVGWRHAYGNLDPLTSVNFIGGDVFGVSGVPLVEDTALLGIGWETTINDDVDLEINYTGLFGDGYQSQNVSGRVSVRF